MNFELALVGEKVKPHQVTAMHLLVAFSMLGVGAMCLLTNVYTTMWKGLPAHMPKLAGGCFIAAGIILLFISIMRNKWLRTPVVNTVFRSLELIFALVLASVFMIKQWWVPAGIFGLMSAALVFSLFWERAGDTAIMVSLNSTGIRLPVTSRKRFLHWYEVEQVLLRHGVLTIDCYDNHLYQWHVQPVPFDARELEGFSAAQILGSKDKRETDW